MTGPEDGPIISPSSSCLGPFVAVMQTAHSGPVGGAVVIVASWPAWQIRAIVLPSGSLKNDHAKKRNDTVTRVPRATPMIQSTPDGIIISIRVIPRARRSGLVGTRGDALLVRLRAPPVEGAANIELVDVMATALHVPKRMVSIVAGDSSRQKRVRVSGIDAATAASVSGNTQAETRTRGLTCPTTSPSSASARKIPGWVPVAFLLSTFAGSSGVSFRNECALRPNRVTLRVTRGRSVCQRTGNRANSGDFEAKVWRMAVVLKTSAKNRPESSDSDSAIGYI
jgi:uncharacterized protein